MEAVERRRRAAARLPVAKASFRGAPRANLALGIVTVLVVDALVVGLVVQHPGFLGGLLLGIPASWVLRRIYQRIPSAQQVAVLVDPDGWVSVPLGRGAVAPLARLVQSGGERTGLGVLIGLVGTVVGLAGLTAVAVGLDQPWVVVVFLGAVAWTLTELMIRILLVRRRLARGWRLGRPPLSGYVAVWHVERGRGWRRGVGADDLLDVVQSRPDLKPAAVTLPRAFLSDPDG